jgi:hypothetical protein
MGKLVLLIEVEPTLYADNVFLVLLTWYEVRHPFDVFRQGNPVSYIMLNSVMYAVALFGGLAFHIGESLRDIAGMPELRAAFERGKLGVRPRKQACH